MDMQRSGWRAWIAPTALFLGLALFGASLLYLAALASGAEVITLEPSRLGVVNGTAILEYPTEYCGCYGGQVDVTYAFPNSSGDASFVTCDDASVAEKGSNVTEPLLSFTHLKSGHFVASPQTIDSIRPYYRSGNFRSCFGTAIIFQWAAPDGDPSANKPTVTATYQTVFLAGKEVPGLLALSVGGALLALGGGLAWARVRGGAQMPPQDDSTVEALRRSLDRMGEQLERTRRHLLFAGVLGVFLWYPILVPWTWHLAASASNEPWVPWAVSGAALSFLVVLTVLWAREFARLDRELNAWRSRIGELRVKEEGLLESLERPEE